MLFLRFFAFFGASQLKVQISCGLLIDLEEQGVHTAWLVLFSLYSSFRVVQLRNALFFSVRAWNAEPLAAGIAAARKAMPSARICASVMGFFTRGAISVLGGGEARGSHGTLGCLLTSSGAWSDGDAARFWELVWLTLGTDTATSMAMGTPEHHPQMEPEMGMLS